MLQCNHDKLRSVKNLRWNPAVAEAAADNHRRLFFLIKTFCIFGKQSLCRSEQPADKRKPDLAAMRMSGKNEIHFRPGIKGYPFRVVRQQDTETAL